MAFGINFFNKKEAPKKTGDTSIVEKAQEVAGSATDLSLKAAALASLIAAGGHTMAAEKMDKDQTPINKIEMSATQSTPKSMENTISFEDAQKLHHEIDSIQSLNKQAESAEKFFETKINATLGSLEKMRQSLPNHDKTEGMYQDIIDYVRSSAGNYDLSTQEGLQKFQDHMIKSALSPSNFTETNPVLEKKLVAYGLSFNPVSNPKDAVTLLQHDLINKVAAQISVENYQETQDQQIAMRESKLDSVSDNQLTASK